MTKPSIVLIPLIVLMAAGIAAAADQPAEPQSVAEPVIVAQADDQPGTESQPEQPMLEPQNRKPPLVLGLGVGSYTPLNSDVEDTFGGTKVRVGLRPILSEAPERMRFMYDVSFYSLKEDDNQAVLIPITVGLMKGFGQGKKTRSYAAINAGMFYADVLAPSLLIDKSGWGFTANATVGMVYNKRLQLELRYEIMDEFAGFKFDSFSAMVGYKVLSWRF